MRSIELIELLAYTSGQWSIYIMNTKHNDKLPDT
jgi:hypothetical protein